MKRGSTIKHETDKKLILERKMVTRRYVLELDRERCIGCQIGPLVCLKEAITHVEGEIAGGRLAKRPSADIDPHKCVFCGMCEVMCPKNAITLTINGKRENPVLVHEAFPDLIQSTTFDKERFDWSRKDFVIDNCPTDAISYDEEQDTLVVDDEHCIRCRQC
ncbi:MAG TPA: 4Fe-4S dicluster domain-containing protein, partial [Chloroflexi bacterium]|nr:4Fe-4S dicluster domain-containing protein [Chloroflexota bacterium]